MRPLSRPKPLTLPPRGGMRTPGVKLVCAGGTVRGGLQGRGLRSTGHPAAPAVYLILAWQLARIRVGTLRRLGFRVLRQELLGLRLVDDVIVDEPFHSATLGSAVEEGIPDG
jgi:hypothetical protein